MIYCTNCGGLGRIANPSYPSSLRALDRRYEDGFLPYPLYESQLIAQYGNLEDVPEEHIHCPICRGSGKLTVRADKSRRVPHGT